MTTCLHCGEELQAYLRNGTRTIWKHKENRRVFCEKEKVDEHKGITSMFSYRAKPKEL